MYGSAVISEIRFEEMENKIESKKHSAIYDGNIVLTETNEVINLHEYDSLNVTPSLNRMLMTMVPEGDRIKVELKGDVNQLSRASKRVEKDNESLMPRFISIIYAAFSIFGAGVLLSPLGLAAKLFFGNSKNEQAGKVVRLYCSCCLASRNRSAQQSGNLSEERSNHFLEDRQWIHLCKKSRFCLHHHSLPCCQKSLATFRGKTLR